MRPDPPAIAAARAWFDRFFHLTMAVSLLLFALSFPFTARMADLNLLVPGMLLSAAGVFGALIVPMVVFHRSWTTALEQVRTWDRMQTRHRQRAEEAASQRDLWP